MTKTEYELPEDQRFLRINNIHLLSDPSKRNPKKTNENPSAFHNAQNQNHTF